MSAFDETPSEWLDDELRRVPLPEGMIDRLRALAAVSDARLDAELRNVPLPIGLLERIQQGALFGESVTAAAVIDDATLDQALRDVHVPLGLTARLSAVAINRARPLTEDRLRDVPLPAGFAERLAHTALWASLTDPELAPPGHETVPHASANWESALAAAVGRQARRPAAIVAFVTALAACYLLAMAAVFRNSFDAAPGGSPTIAVGAHWLDDAGDATSLTFGTTRPLPENPKIDARALADSMRVDGLLFDPSFGEGPFPEEGPLPPEADGLEPVRPWEKMGVVGSNAAPAVQAIRVDAPAAKGLIPAWKDPDLLLFLLARGVHPVVPLNPAMQPASDASLLTCRIPTTTSTESYEAAWSLLGRPNLSHTERQAALRWLLAEVRPEEFLAALDYRFTPPAPETLGVRTAGGVSPFGEPQQRLLQVAVVAGAASPRRTAPQEQRPQEQGPVIAEDVRLSVTFNPRTVAAYRLMGHEATSVLGVHKADVELRLRAGDVCTGLFEVELRGGGDDLVATVEITWRDPLQSGTRRETRRISRWQLADSLPETPASVQAAAIAAETAELLRRSPLAAGRGHSWSRIRQVAAEAPPALAEEPTFRRLLGLVDRVDPRGVR